MLESCAHDNNIPHDDVIEVLNGRMGACVWFAWMRAHVVIMQLVCFK